MLLRVTVLYLEIEYRICLYV